MNAVQRAESGGGVIAQNGSALSREQWIHRCAARFQVVAALDESLAVQMAESQHEVLEGDLSENPEQSADEEMSYWTAD